MKPPEYLAMDRGGIAHAVAWSGAKEAFCGLKLFNFHKRIGLNRYESGYGYVYEPPPGLKVTCLKCIAEESVWTETQHSH